MGNVAWAQTADDFIIDQFGDDTTLSSWSRAWGLTPTFEWDPDQNADGNPDTPGALKVTIPFDLVTYQGNNDCCFQRPLGETIDFENYTRIHFDVKVDPASSHLSTSWGAGQFGTLDVIARNTDWSVQLHNITTGDAWMGADDYGVWKHHALEVDKTLTTHHDMVALMFQMWSGWVEGDGATGGHTNTVYFWIDNLYLEKNTNTAPIPPPTVSVKPATSGLQLIASQAGGQWQRQGFRTVDADKSWVGVTRPVTYELTIKDAPLKNGFQAHMFLVPNSTGDTTPDWNRPDTVMIWIADQGNGAANINFGFKTNQPSGNSQIYNENHLAELASTKILGTWKVTFNNNTDVTMTAPDGASTNFTMAAEAVAKFADPLTVYFGVQPNNLDNIGSGYVFSNVKITGVANPIDDSFPGPDFAAVWAEAAEDPAGVFISAADAKWWFNWTLPAVGFGPQVSAAVQGAPWIDLDLGKSFKNGTQQSLLVSASELPAGNSAFLRMVQREFTKLQVLMPGETAAPGTATGKTGTPTPQTPGVEFDVIVNAVDDNWNLATTGRDVINITCSDVWAYLPADAALVNGTRTFKVTFNDAGTFTVTATDVTDPTKTANTGSPTVCQ